MSRQSNTPGDKSGKKVGFATNLTSFDPQSQSPPSAGSQLWDNETDHLLSYFLGGDFGSNGTIPEFGSTEQSTNQEGLTSTSTPHFQEPKAERTTRNSAIDRENKRGLPSTTGGDGTRQVVPGQPSQSGPILQREIGRPENASALASSFEDEPMQPPTPKVPQYHSRPNGRRSTNNGKKNDVSWNKPAGPAKSTSSGDLSIPTSQYAVPSSASSSSSSLSTMANTLVTGGPLLYQQMQQQQQQNPHLYAMGMAALQQQQQQQQGVPSPVSPAAMIGTPETMLLPPPPSAGAHPPVSAYQTAAGEAGGHQYPPPHPTSNAVAQQQHLAWLQQLNEMAKAAQQPQANSHIQAPHSGQMLPPPPVSGQQHPSTQQPPHPYMYSPFPHLTFYGPAAAAAAAALQSTKNPAPEESEEKRAKRLERNRESARKSRRRKKERLLAMEGKANGMHQKIAKERQRQIEVLVPGLRQWRGRQLESMVEGVDTHKLSPDRARLMTCIRETGPFSPIFQAVLEFQANSLQAYMLPRYQKLWLWFAMQHEGYFSAGKEEYIKRDPDRLIVRTSSGKISSKQVGDELTNGLGERGKRPARSKGSVDDISRTSRADDAARTWPLLCYEHQFSVDQEEKFLALHRKLQSKHNIGDFWKKSRAASEAASSLRVAMESVCHVASQREERTLVGVLKTDQIAKYRAWVVMNQERCSRSMRQKYKLDASDGFTTTSSGKKGSDAMVSQRESLQDICQRLEKVLRISKNSS